jgi:ABC-type polar amino acid transport system ATPase subunit
MLWEIKDVMKTLKVNQNKIVEELEKIFFNNRDKRIVVVGTTSSGKSTILKKIKNAYDMDELIFPQLTKKEKEYVCQTPWTSEIGRTMTKWVKEKIQIKKSFPIFGTVVIDSDLIIYLKIDDELLKKRTETRGVKYLDAKNMQKQIENEIEVSKIPVLTFNIL